ncbi:MAG TPA: 2-oxo acid dehydrogenase subunit E2 [Polyangiaceae bacterium]|nr:2-oxo acid dehydrogenase subunit E2 [Polyangiaceae bacterium]
MIEVTMPQLGESVAEGTVTQWHVKEGDYVEREQPLLEVATDKADSEVPSPGSGIIKSISAAEGDIVATGGLLCTIDDSAMKPAGGDAPATEKVQEGPIDGGGSAPTEPAPTPSGAGLASPAIRQLARDRGVDLSKVKGTGERGRITRADVEEASRGGGSAGPMSLPGPPSSGGHDFDATPTPSQARQATERAEEIGQLLNAEVPIPGVGYRSYKVPPYKEKEGDEIVPFNRRRRITADHMVYSTQVSPHVVTVAEIDLHATSKLRDQHKRAFKEEGVPLTFLTFVLAAVVKALREYPKLNARVLDDSYVVFKDLNVGIAVDTPGGLLVANIKQTDRLSMRGIASSIDDLARRARAGKITADDLMGTTFTVSNPGRKGNLFGAAIISQPNVGILRMGEIKKRPVVVAGADGDDQIAIHPVMYSALSYDHRIVDGVEANEFLWCIADILQKAEFEI